MKTILRFLYRPRLFLIFLISGVLFLMFCNYCNRLVKSAGIGKIYTDVSTTPYNHVGLVLGTSKYLYGKYMNPYFVNRLEAAIQLYECCKIDHIIVSGDNGRKEYDEASDMKNYLIKRGIPENSITCDYAGFRTFDSMVRAKAVFGQNKLTIISQQFHNERALYICKHIGLDAIAFNAKEVYRGPRSKIREYFARTKAFIDLKILNQKPRFLGDPIAIYVQR